MFPGPLKPLLAAALLMFAANSALALTKYDVAIDTSTLNGTDGYLYLTYIPTNGADSTAAVAYFTTDGTLGAQDTSSIVDGSAVTGSLPATVTFANTHGINDYNQAIHFGHLIEFLLTFSDPLPGGLPGGGSSFSLALFADVGGGSPLLTADGTLFTVSLANEGTATVPTAATQAVLTSVPIPATPWLFGLGFAALAGARTANRKTGAGYSAEIPF